MGLQGSRNWMGCLAQPGPATEWRRAGEPEEPLKVEGGCRCPRPVPGNTSPSDVFWPEGNLQRPQLKWLLVEDLRGS